MAHQWQSAFDPQAAEGDDQKKALAVHIALLPVGERGSLLYFSGNRWDTDNHKAGKVDHTVLFDYASRTAARPGSPAGPGGLVPDDFLDVFCSGHAMLADGRLLVAGGTSAMTIADPSNPHDGHWGGLREAFVFDPAAVPKWQPIAPMNTCPVPGFEGRGGGRWYPSIITLPDGSLLALCGHPRVFSTAFDEADPADYPATEDDPRHNNNSPERYRPCINAWDLLNPDGIGEGYLHDFAVFYPRAHVLPSGLVLIVQPLYAFPHELTEGASIDLSGAWAHKSLIYDADNAKIVAGFAGPDLKIEANYLVPGFAAQSTTSVLLPLLPEKDYQSDILICGGHTAARATISTGAEASSTWIATSARSNFFSEDGTPSIPQRANALATLLPNGQVLVTGGTNVWKDPKTLPQDQFDATFAVRVPEIYDPATGTWTALTDAPAQVPRGYHSVALLMTDGRVLTAGSERDNVFGHQSSEYRMEVFEPDYINAPNRLQITSAPPCISYGEAFHVGFDPAAGNDVSRAAVTRFGSATHGFDYDQRYVGLTFKVESPGLLLVTAPPQSAVAPPGYYMLWLIDSGGRPCIQAATVRVGAQQLTAELDRSVFSIYDVQTNARAGETTYKRAFYAVFNGFIPFEVVDLEFSATFSQQGLTATLSPWDSEPNPALEDPTHPQLIQRTVFAFDLTFAGTVAFDGLTGGDALRNVTLTVKAGDWQTTSEIVLVMEPSPFMTDGDKPWLSVDLRVFQVTPTSASRWLPGQPFNTPNDYIVALLQSLNNNVDAGQAMFSDLPDAEAASALSLLPTATGAPDGPPIYSFALARVRMDSQTVAANYVRVLFRLFRTLRPSLTYDTTSLYRRFENPVVAGGTQVTTDAMPLLGVEGADIVSIPFFAAPRVGPGQDMTVQTDASNLLTVPAGAGEQIRFFGCWLDINQPNQKHFPRYPGGATNFGGFSSSDLLSIQELITGFHQCLVAEVHYKLDTTSPELPRPGDTPATSDKLSQRNLALTTSANPGSLSTRTVQHSFELKGIGTRPVTGADLGYDERHDSLLLWWGNVPKKTEVDIYLPGIPAEDVLRLRPPSHACTMRMVDERTIRCSSSGDLGDCLFVPIPGWNDGSLAGLLTLRLPDGVRHGEKFVLTAQHLSGPKRLVVGAFELQIAVNADHSQLLRDDKDQLAILKYLLSRTPSDDRWWPILSRMVGQLSGRVAAFGVDPGGIQPSQWGSGPHDSVLPAVGATTGSTDYLSCADGLPGVRFAAETFIPVGLEAEIEIEAKIRVRVKKIPK
ncbi:galactose oxidase-like domain-containing protein [Paraburkholderia sp. J10-1]|uniref:galactose oxidase-like domain-containing protein n=1 Tax=Paraburkholderia sp. J10-1 TaxID=2805430 RepID=UPI002AB6C787|nr:galactose oxidase-like domain-containing protein [Paraburkholderia sp. J10-1]